MTWLLLKVGQHFSGGVEDEVAVGAGGDNAAMQDEGLGFSLLDSRPARSSTSEMQGAGVVLVRIAVSVVDVNGGFAAD